MHFQGHVEPVFSGTGKKGLEYVRDNSVSVQTIVARWPPDSTEYRGFLDTLRTYPDRALRRGWISSESVASRYEDALTAAHDHLAAADSGLARLDLETVARQAQADSGRVLTSEAYALLYHNSRFLAERLPAP